MFNTIGPKPSATTLDQKTATCEDGNACGVPIVKIMVCRPEPVVL
jgi:hypothetical protein